MTRISNTFVPLFLLLTYNICSIIKIVYGNGESESEWHNTWKCVPIRLDFCKDVAYNETINMEGGISNPYTDKTNQDEIKSELSHFTLLLRTGCSVHLRLLLCSAYLPYCSPKVEKPITACRPLCEEVKRKCLKHMDTFDFGWPSSLECSKFPKKNSIESLCLNGGLTSLNATKEISEKSVLSTKSKFSKIDEKIYTLNHSPTSSKEIDNHIPCSLGYSRNSKNYFFSQKTKTCVLDCFKNGLFSSEEKDSVEKWMSALSSCCCLICSVALVVSLVEYKRVLYPEKAVVFITVCFVFYSIGHIIRIVYTRENISCGEENGKKYMLRDGSTNVACSSIFVLSYGFFMAQNIWWVILTITWFLNSGLKWKKQTLTKNVKYFHVVAWGIPCAKTLVILVLRKIDGNELTGMCSIGNHHERLSSLSGFVLGPLFTYLLTGTIFLLFGKVVSFKLLSSSSDNSKTFLFKQENNSVGPLAVSHALFSAYILSMYFYEYFNKTLWLNDVYLERPNFYLFLLRIIFEFMIGITAAAWLLILYLPGFCKKLLRKIRSSNHPSPLLSRFSSRPNESFI
uniref:Frizzled4/9/10 n=1 Tax=Hydra vulgaris TaxID=6087 RepID=A1IKD5_HYDVU|nr:Frizzled4/9/10 [Hydra vulgaris]